MTADHDAAKRSRVIRNAVILGVAAFAVYIGFILIVQSRG